LGSWCPPVASDRGGSSLVKCASITVGRSMMAADAPGLCHRHRCARKIDRLIGAATASPLPDGQNSWQCPNPSLSSRSRENIPLYRNSDFAYVSAIPAHQGGAILCRHVSRAGLRWTRQRRARDVGAGPDEPGEVPTACGRTALRFVLPTFLRRVCTLPEDPVAKMAVRTAKPCGPGRRCYGQAVCGDARQPNRADGIVNSRGEGGQKELGSRESTA
jgi:hypothetical protein